MGSQASDTRGATAADKPPANAESVGPNPLAEPSSNPGSGVSSNPARAVRDHQGADLAALELRLRAALDRAERGTHLLEEAVGKRRSRR